MNLFSKAIEKALVNEMTRIANDVAERAKENSSWSTQIPKAISVSEVESSGDGVYSISINVDISESGAPQARAFEYGSGEHATQGPVGTYKITPKNAPYLAFPFTLKYMPGRKFSGMLGYTNRELYQELEEVGQASGITFWNYVDHPGVEPKPYLRPAVEAARGRIRNRLVSMFSKTLRDDFVKIVFSEE